MDMVKKRCACCNGSGRVMGGGMMHQECDDCEGRGRIYVSEVKEVKPNEINKETDEYKKAIKKIKKLSPEISDSDAEKMFEKAWDETE